MREFVIALLCLVSCSSQHGELTKRKEIRTQKQLEDERRLELQHIA
jgi:hypothetical protein